MRESKNPFYMHGIKSNLSESIFWKFYVFKYMPWLARMLKLRFLTEEVAMFFRNLVEATIRVREEQDIVRPDMLQLMMESGNKENGRHKLTTEEMTIHAFGFFLGGFDTSSTLMSFAAYEISVKEDIQKRLQTEIDQVLEHTNGQMDYDVVNNMEYLDAVLNETLRMYPVVALLDRVCQLDFQLPPILPGAKPYTIKKGDAVFIPVYGLHHDSQYFKQSEKFDPDRFLGEQKKTHSQLCSFSAVRIGP